jgi:chemotaxis regulatin CheY-phosphate phosphatase CheZ
MAYRKLADKDLDAAIADTKEAIQRSHDLLKVVAEKPITKGLTAVAESTPAIIEKLEDDLKKLEKARAKISEA